MRLKKFGTLIINGAIISGLILPLVAQADAASAVSYLKTKSLNPWITMALVAAGESADVDYLKSAPGALVTDYEAAVLALVSVGKDPKTFPNEDFVAKIKSFYSGVQIGDAGTLNDDIFGLLALAAAGEGGADPVVSGAKDFILANQNPDGGWPFTVGGSSDTNMTAMAMMALLEVGMSSADPVILAAENYLRAAQNSDGGFPYDPVSPWGTDSDASSDAWVLSAINKLGQNAALWNKNGNTPESHLWTLQNNSGFFAYQTGGGEDAFSAVTTAYAVIALSGKAYPVIAGRSAGGTGPTKGIATVVHNVINDNGGSKQASDFQFEIKVNGAAVATVPGASGYGTGTFVNPGSYEMAVVADPGYLTTMSGECAGMVVAGQSVTCTFTSDDIALAQEVSGEVLGKTCEPYLPADSYIRSGGKELFNLIVKLQQFLNSHEGETLTVNGIYDVQTIGAVKRFQLAHADRVLRPWGISQPTGNTYITTTAMINELADPDCAGQAIPELAVSSS